MPHLRRFLTVLSLCCVALVALPVLATAHGGGYRGDRHDPSRARQICAEVGAPLAEGSIYGHLGRAAHSTLSGAQMQALQAACTKLASAYTTERGADEAAGNALRSAIQTARGQLQSSCPRGFRHHHRDGGGSLYRIPSPCEEARKTYDAAVAAAEKTFQQAHEEAAQKLQAALEEFEATAQSVLPAGSAAGADHHRNGDGRRCHH